jgi:Cytochrome c oxidase subunit IV
MKIEWRTVIGAAIFLALICLIYWAWSLEATGTTLLLFSGVAYLILGGFLIMVWLRRKKLPRPEDKDDGTFEETAERPVDFFPSSSIWPAGMGLGVTFIAIALIFGNFYWLIGLPLFFGAIIGFSVEAEAGFETRAQLSEQEREMSLHDVPGVHSDTATDH